MPLAEDSITLHGPRDPELRQEFNQLETEEDKQDFLDALDALDEVERERAVPWESVKRDLGL